MRRVPDESARRQGQSALRASFQLSNENLKVRDVHNVASRICNDCKKQGFKTYVEPEPPAKKKKKVQSPVCTFAIKSTGHKWLKWLKDLAA